MTEAERTIRNTRWALACEIRMARNVARSMRRRADETEPTGDWKLAQSCRNVAAGHDETLIALRAVSRTLRGV